MSGGHPSHDDGAHHDHAHDFDPEPAQELSPGEPRTPGWIPALGLALFLCAGIFFLASQQRDESPAPTPEPAKPSTSARAIPAQIRPAATDTAAPPGLPSALTSAQRPTPEQARELRKRLEEIRKRQAAPSAAPAAPAAPAADPHAGHGH